MKEDVLLIMSLWPSTRALAKDLDIPPSHCRVIRCRGRIPRAYWHDLVAAAKRRKIPGLTLNYLKEVHKSVGDRRS